MRNEIAHDFSEQQLGKKKPGYPLLGTCFFCGENMTIDFRDHGTMICACSHCGGQVRLAAEVTVKPDVSVLREEGMYGPAVSVCGCRYTERQVKLASEQAENEVRSGQIPPDSQADRVKELAIGLMNGTMDVDISDNRRIKPVDEIGKPAKKVKQHAKKETEEEKTEE